MVANYLTGKALAYHAHTVMPASGELTFASQQQLVSKEKRWGQMHGKDPLNLTIHVLCCIAWPRRIVLSLEKYNEMHRVKRNKTTQDILL